jgi:hypothetical protein
MKKSRHSEEKIIAAVKQMEGGRKTAEVARELGVSAATLYAWKSKYAGMQVKSSSAKSLAVKGGHPKGHLLFFRRSCNQWSCCSDQQSQTCCNLAR